MSNDTCWACDYARDNDGNRPDGAWGRISTCARKPGEPITADSSPCGDFVLDKGAQVYCLDCNLWTKRPAEEVEEALTAILEDDGRGYCEVVGSLCSGKLPACDAFELRKLLPAVKRCLDCTHWNKDHPAPPGADALGPVGLCKETGAFAPEITPACDLFKARKQLVRAVRIEDLVALPPVVKRDPFDVSVEQSADRLREIRRIITEAPEEIGRLVELLPTWRAGEPLIADDLQAMVLVTQWTVTQLAQITQGDPE